MYSRVHSFEKDATVAMELSYTLASKAPLSVHGLCTLWWYLSNAHTPWYKSQYPCYVSWYSRRIGNMKPISLVMQLTLWQF